jgi:hypothetical protein
VQTITEVLVADCNIPQAVVSNILLPYIVNDKGSSLFYREVDSFKTLPREVGYEWNNRLNHYCPGLCGSILRRTSQVCLVPMLNCGCALAQCLYSCFHCVWSYGIVRLPLLLIWLLYAVWVIAWSCCAAVFTMCYAVLQCLWSYAQCRLVPMDMNAICQVYNRALYCGNRCTPTLRKISAILFQNPCLALAMHCRSWLFCSALNNNRFLFHRSVCADLLEYVFDGGLRQTRRFAILDDELDDATESCSCRGFTDVLYVTATQEAFYCPRHKQDALTQAIAI